MLLLLLLLLGIPLLLLLLGWVLRLLTKHVERVHARRAARLVCLHTHASTHVHSLTHHGLEPTCHWLEATWLLRLRLLHHHAKGVRARQILRLELIGLRRRILSACVLLLRVKVIQLGQSDVLEGSGFVHGLGGVMPCVREDVLESILQWLVLP